RYVQRQRRSGLSGVEREGADQFARQHGNLQAGNIDGGHAAAGQLVEIVVAAYGQAGHGNVYAHLDDIAFHGRNRQGVVDLDGAGVVDRIGGDVGQRQVVADIAQRYGRELRAFGEVGG